MGKKSRRHQSLPQDTPSRQVPPKEGAGKGKERGFHRRILLSVVLVVVLFAAAGPGWIFYQRHFAVPDLDFKGYNLLFVTIDTLRADHLGAYGYDKIKTENLDRLAAQGYLFRRAISQVPLTLPSHTSIFTGTYPSYHGVRDNGGYFVSPQSVTLAEILKQHGYRTAAFVSAFILDSKWGLDQGFDTYYDDFDITKADETGIGEVQRPGGQTNEVALKWLESAASPFFCWIHYYDPHDPYEPPEPFRSDYAGRLYDGEIAYTDVLVGQVLDLLKKRKLTDKTLIVVTGDHGEGLGEHQELTHALFLYNSTLHVPLIMKFPGQASGEILQTVQHLDILPTLLDLLNIEKPPHLQGRSLLPLLKHQKMGETMALSESLYAEKHYGWSPLFSLTTDKYQFIDAPRPELYDVERDSGEKNNLCATLPALAKVSKERIAELLREHTLRQEHVEMDAETQEKLKALGYIGSGPSEKMKQSGKNIDPKDKIALVEALHAAFADMRKNLLADAEAKVGRVIREDPEIVDGYLLQGMIASKKQDYDLAIRSFQQTLSLRPDHLIALFNLALVYQKNGETDKAIEGFKEVLRQDPHYLKAMVNLAQIYTEKNQPDLALSYYQQAINRYQQMLKSSTTIEAIVSIHDTLSGVYFGQGKIDEAEKEIREIIKLKPDRPDAHYNLAQIYEKRGMRQQAAEEYQKEIQYNPTNFKAYNDYALLLREEGKYDLAIPLLEQAVHIQPDSYGPRYVLAESLLQTGGSLQEARANAEKAVDLNPRFKRGFVLLADIYSKLGMNKEATDAKKAASLL